MGLPEQDRGPLWDVVSVGAPVIIGVLAVLAPAAALAGWALYLIDPGLPAEVWSAYRDALTPNPEAFRADPVKGCDR